MKIYKLEYQSKVMGVRISDIPNFRYSLDLEYELAKKVLSNIDKKDIVNGGTLSLKEEDNTYVTENEVDVINISSVKECLRYINSGNAAIEKDSKLISMYYGYKTSISTYAKGKLNKLLPELLGNTGLTYITTKISALPPDKRIGENYVQLFLKEKDKKHKPHSYDRKGIGLYLDVEDLDDTGVTSITAEVIAIRVVHYNRHYCGSEPSRKVHTVATYKKSFSTDGYGSGYDLPLEYVEELVNPFFKEIVEFFKSNIPKIAQELSNASNHLNDFLPLSKDKLIELISIYPKCYYCKCDGTPIFYGELSSTEEHLEEMTDRYIVINGFRKYLVWNNELYLWFGWDEKASWNT